MHSENILSHKNLLRLLFKKEHQVTVLERLMLDGIYHFLKFFMFGYFKMLKVFLCSIVQTVKKLY